jgi:hypothetical protein
MLPLDVSLDAAPPTHRQQVRRPRSADGDGLVPVRLGAELARGRGWPAGTEVLVDPDRRPQQGDVVVVREGGRVSAGVLERRFGRNVLRNDRGTAWVAPATEVVGVVTQVGAALEGMPEG